MTDILHRVTDRTGNGSEGWMADVQRALALILIGFLALASFGLVVRLIISADIASVVDIAKIMLAALVNMGLIALGFFFGSSQSKEKADQSQQKIMEKLTSAAPPAVGGPVAPLAGPTPIVVAWWSLLTDDERAAIEKASNSDATAATFMAASRVGRASETDLANMVNGGLLTRERADIIKAV
jgi:hypothetical protein